MNTSNRATILRAIVFLFACGFVVVTLTHVGDVYDAFSKLTTPQWNGHTSGEGVVESVHLDAEADNVTDDSIDIGKVLSAEELHPDWVNLALKKRIYMSSFDSRVLGIAENAVNGNATCVSPTQVALTAREPAPWLQVDLGYNYDVRFVRLTFHEFQFDDAISTDLPFRILVSPDAGGDYDDHDWQDLVTGPTGNPELRQLENHVYELDVHSRHAHMCGSCLRGTGTKRVTHPPVCGRFVRVQLARVGVLGICEMEVFGPEIPCGMDHIPENPACRARDVQGDYQGVYQCPREE